MNKSRANVKKEGQMDDHFSTIQKSTFCNLIDKTLKKRRQKCIYRRSDVLLDELGEAEPALVENVLRLVLFSGQIEPQVVHVRVEIEELVRRLSSPLFALVVSNERAEHTIGQELGIAQAQVGHRTCVPGAEPFVDGGALVRVAVLGGDRISHQHERDRTQELGGRISLLIPVCNANKQRVKAR